MILRDFSCEQEKQCSNNKLWFVQKLNWVGKHDTGRYVLAKCVVHTRTAGRAAPVLNAIGGTASTMHGHDAASHRSPCRHPAEGSATRGALDWTPTSVVNKRHPSNTVHVACTAMDERYDLHLTRHHRYVWRCDNELFVHADRGSYFGCKACNLGIRSRDPQVSQGKDCMPPQVLPTFN